MVRNSLFILGLMLVFFSCANIGNPSGGPEDTTPPMLDQKESTRNFQTNFKKQKIKLVFDEFVELKDIFNQVIVTPPLQKRWKLTKKLKTITFEFDKDEVLRDSATYIINFGEAIRDYNAGNPVSDLRFVFSTGSFIDSMEVSGLIVDAITGEPAEGILLMLYDNLADTVVRTEKPFYFAKTDKSGAYTIQNVKSDTFKVFALKDEDLNYLFNQENELIGFPDSLFYLSKEKEIIPTIGVFKERPELKLVPPSNKQYGLVNLKFNQEPFDVEIVQEDIGQQIIFEPEQDSIKVWYNQDDTTTWNIFLAQGNNFRDTFLVKPSDKKDFLTKDSLKRANTRTAKKIIVNPVKPAKILFNHPLATIDSSGILLLEDSFETVVYPNLTLENRAVVVNYSWKENIIYQVRLLPGSVQDIFDLENQDTIQQTYQIAEKKSFGDINLKVIELDSTEHYVINLYFKNKTNLVASYPVSKTSFFEKKLETLPAGSYILDIITDINANGRWDSGSYDLKTQPEPLFSKTLKELKENWEIDEEVTYKK